MNWRLEGIYGNSWDNTRIICTSRRSTTVKVSKRCERLNLKGEISKKLDERNFVKSILFLDKIRDRMLDSICFSRMSLKIQRLMAADNSNNKQQVILVTGGYDHTIKVWQPYTGVCQHTVEHTDSQVNALGITPNKYIMAAAGYQQLRMYDLASNNPNPFVRYEGISKNITQLGFQEEGKWMYTGGEDCSARIWDLRSCTFQCQRIFQVSAPVNCVCLHPNQAELIVGDQSGVIHLWDLRSDHNEQLIPEAEASVQDIAIDQDGTYMAAVNNKGNCYVWTLTGGVGEEPTRLNPRHKLSAHKRYALRCKFSPDSTLLVTTSADQTARVWKTTDFSEVQVLQHDAKRWVWDAAFSADSQYVFTASSDCVARLWNVSTGTVEREYKGHQKAITALAFRDEEISVS